jgi:hypothetical protein
VNTTNRRDTGLSTRTVADKLLIKPNTTIWSSHTERLNLIAGLPESLTITAGPADAAAAVVFADDAGSLRDILNTHRDQIAQPGILWVAYPKGNRTDINRDTLWPILTEYGMRPIGQVAVDDVWSALRFRPLKEGEAPFTGGR